MKDCIFCKMASGKVKVKKIYENDNFFSIPDKNPSAPGHSLVISKKHFRTALSLPNELGPDFLDCVKKTTSKLMKKYSASGFNLLNNGYASGGQFVPHFHLHILPRKKGDGIRNFVKK